MNIQQLSTDEIQLVCHSASAIAEELPVRRMLTELQLRITHCPTGIVLLFNTPVVAGEPHGAVSYVQLHHAKKSSQRTDRALHGQTAGLLAPESILDLLGNILLDRLHGDSEPDSTFVTLIAAAICLLAQRHRLCVGMERNEAGALPRWQEERAKSYMEEQLSEQITVQDVARHCGMSASHLARAFRVSEGLPPYRWLIRRRIEQAKKLLQFTAMALVDISMECGFAEQSHFNHAFRRDVGIAPGSWRRVHRRAPTTDGLAKAG